MSHFPKYKLTDKQIKGIANIVLHEQGSIAGWYAEASQIANRTDIRGDSYATGANAVKTVTSGWYAKGKARYAAGTSNATVIEIVKRVFCEGFRTLPRYIDEHDCMSDISTVKDGDKNVKADKSKWKRHTTIVRNKMGSTYRFYDFPGGYKTGVDPFGYTSLAYRQKWGDFCYTLPEAIGIADRIVSLLAVYHAYIAAHYKHFTNKYDSKIVSYAIAKKQVSAKKTVGITCVVPLRWALYELGIKNDDGKALISAPGGSFAKYYTGKVKTYFKRYTSTGAIGKTVKQAVDAGQFKAGDIICFQKLTHTAVYSGKGYLFYGGGSECVKDGHYPNGIRQDYANSKDYAHRKIAEVLRMRTTTVTKETTKAASSASKAEEKTKSEADLRQLVVNTAAMLLGVKEGSAEHRMIIDKFNASGLCSRYKMTTLDAWCATFVSFLFIVTKLAGKPGSGALFQCCECSCARMIDLAKEQKIWNENDAYIPKPGDIILYHWRDSGKGDDKGTPNHVGVVQYVKDSYIYVIEGNYQDAVGIRKIAVNGRFIRGFICPKYSSFSSKDKSTASTQKMAETDAQEARKPYPYKYPALPPRGYFKFGDGYLQYRGFATQVRRVQKLVSWITGIALTEDGAYGQKTEDTVKKAQKVLGIKPDGLFGSDTLAKARAYTE